MNNVTLKDLDQKAQQLSDIIGYTLHVRQGAGNFKLVRQTPDSTSLNYSEVIGFTKREAWDTLQAMQDGIALYQHHEQDRKRKALKAEYQDAPTEWIDALV